MKKFLKSLGVLLAAVLGGIAYRMGGSGRFGRFWRPLGQACALVAAMACVGRIWLAWQPIVGTFLSFGMSWLETTYFKKPGTDAKWYNWGLVGLVFGLIPLPYCAFTNSCWLGFGLRIPVCVGLTIWWQQELSQQVCNDINLFLPDGKHIGKDVTDEFGRGFINVATLPILLV